ncbi:hypothetical protein KY386_02035 [Candidatus Parcubacteria bacterium]|nr:hypothetical protein [Candidatus Parcubacteria bacterium]
MKVAILGRQPKISLAELISLFGPTVRPLAGEAAMLAVPRIDLTRLGGTQKIARPVASLPTRNWNQIIDNLASADIAHQMFNGQTGKLTIGLSAYGLGIGGQNLFKGGLELKKRLRGLGYQIRVVPPKNSSVSAAQVTHSRMIEAGADVVLAPHGQETIVAVTEQVQAIDAYSRRDYGRPARSAKVGMLPPKLAQIMINLANPPAGSTVLDPFCGTGVVLQEALLMGFAAVGSDIDQQMVRSSRTNLDWLTDRFNLPTGSAYRLLEPADARSHRWPPTIGAVVTEGYLGPPLSSPPTAAALAELQTAARRLILEFLTNLHPQIAAGTPICLTLPAWKQNRGFARLDMIDQITALGYTQKQFLPVRQPDLLYHRPDQVVARELLALTRV